MKNETYYELRTSRGKPVHQFGTKELMEEWLLELALTRPEFSQMLLKYKVTTSYKEEPC